MACQDGISTLSSTSASRSSALPHARHMQIWNLFLLSDSIYRLRNTMLNRWCIWYGALRSLLGHVGSQSARARVAVDLGPALQRLPNGHYQANARTLARAQYIKKLRASHPWVDIPDLHMFLMGFDAGEQFSRLCYIPAEQTQGEKLGSCDQFSQVPNTGTDASSHCRGHAQG
jgi:hypothetical protein